MYSSVTCHIKSADNIDDAAQQTSYESVCSVAGNIAAWRASTDDNAEEAAHSRRNQRAAMARRRFLYKQCMSSTSKTQNRQTSYI